MPPNQNVSGIIDTMHLKNILRQIKANRRDRFHQLLLQFSTRTPLWHSGWSRSRPSQHINLTGDYLWRSSAKIGAGKFRPLRPLQPA
ncbi:hypothetical protein IG197_35015 (plasmid) [Aminobacter sp. SR38]|uniref:hypothetical protein n=1 Tax=Aminobacter sp. SR38 TaxID=2774562 RepID=UPI0017806B71|nr:hypothetical protein [Aminobacter sp. SR38]QOF75886.1 hypothetical protein IG197_35015 [Aminobacter sp. SR38]